MHFFFWRNLPVFVTLAAVVWVQFKLAAWLLERLKPISPVRKLALRLAPFVATAWIVFGILGGLPHFYYVLPFSPVWTWVRGAAMLWVLGSLATYAVLFFVRRVPHFNGERRGFLRVVGGALVATPAAALGYGVFIQRNDLRVTEIDVPITNLPKDLNGLRVVQLSDIHLSPFLSEEVLARSIDMANELRAHVALVTGDFITAPGDPLHACLRQVARLCADSGIFGCMGNHEEYARAVHATEEIGTRLGIRFLRQRAIPLRFGNSILNLGGVDYQRANKPYMVDAGAMIVPGATNVLLSHNPDVFDVAAAQGWDLTVSGHTHGGQITVEILNQNLDIARYYTPYVYGLYTKGPASIWVTRGIGTVGVPARLGAPPEVVLIRLLCATSS